MFVRPNFANIYLRGMRDRIMRRGIGAGNHCRLTAFLRSIYLINLDEYSSAITSLRRLENNSNCRPVFFFFRNISRINVNEVSAVG